MSTTEQQLQEDIIDFAIAYFAGNDTISEDYRLAPSTRRKALTALLLVNPDWFEGEEANHSGVSYPAITETPVSEYGMEVQVKRQWSVAFGPSSPLCVVGLLREGEKPDLLMLEAEDIPHIGGEWAEDERELTNDINEAIAAYTEETQTYIIKLFVQYGYEAAEHLINMVERETARVLNSQGGQG